MSRENEGRVHHPSRRYNNAIKQLKNSSISSKNKELITKFLDESLAEGIGKLRLSKCVIILKKIAQKLDKDFDKATKQDIVNYVRDLGLNDNYTDWTKYDYKVTLKKFYKIIKGNGEEYPEEVKWIKATRKLNNHKIPEELITPEEIKKLSNVATDQRDRAIVITLYESGARAGELLSMRMKHVVFDKYGALVILKGKTGTRRIRLVASVPALSAWLDVHPYRDEKEGWLWLGKSTLNRNKRLSYAGLKKMLRELASRAKIQKPVNPHSFRHSRATELAKSLTEAQLCMIMGWVQGSKQAATYVHLSQRDTDKAILKLHGLLEMEEEEPGLMAIKCPRCKQHNTPGARFCRTCGMALDPQAALDAEDKDKQIGISVMEALRNNPELVGQIGEVLARALENKDY